MEDYKDLTTYRILRDFCQEIKIRFTIRNYDAHKFSEDRQYIERLPALQLYRYPKQELLETFYPDMEPFENILNTLLDFEQKQKDHEHKKQVWKNRLQKVLPFLKSKSSA